MHTFFAVNVIVTSLSFLRRDRLRIPDDNRSRSIVHSFYCESTSNGLRHRPCIHTRNILIWRFRFSSNRRSTPSCSKSSLYGVRLSPSLCGCLVWTIGVAGLDVAGDAAAEGAIDKSPRAEEREGAVVLLISPDSDSVTTVVVSESNVVVAALVASGESDGTAGSGALSVAGASRDATLGAACRTPPKMWTSSSTTR